MTEAPDQQIQRRILEIVNEVVAEYPDASEDDTLAIVNARCEKEIGEDELRAFYTRSYQRARFEDAKARAEEWELGADDGQR